ncbi:hypothetical protein GDO81_024295 [Engystomops pustulosus]|uniref:Aromatic amino acid beta-eliminating lyase/threonine aldolase domain-containing protein n=1 Tax=Engystomops pustulosus TaxID=76066 RepID=A0AAV6ZN83_ENGPU|nr:hypothetical protein GDO81_024295 [Engystomops pustulosus]
MLKTAVALGLLCRVRRTSARHLYTDPAPFWIPTVRSIYSRGRIGRIMASVVVDLRSDTVTKPCAEMRRAMAEAEVGDDVYGEDPTVNEIQRYAAQLLGTEDALFVTSGTMGNLISVMVHCRHRASEILLGDESHLYFYEQGGVAQVAGVFSRPVRTLKDGRLDLKDLENKIQHGYPDPHFGQTRLICLENSHNRTGGRVLPLSYMREVRELADRYGLKIHLDGARLLNAAEALGVEPAEIVRLCDSVSLCLSKGLGAPIGSLIGGKADFIAEARRARKMLGGGMRQVGVLAAAGLVALRRAKDNVRLDHQNAKMFAKAVQDLGSPICSTDPAEVESNMVMLTVTPPLLGQDLCDRLSAEDQSGVVVKALAFSPVRVRLVWHRDVSTENTLQALEKLKGVLLNYRDGATPRG